MNKRNSFKLLICLLVVILLTSVDKVRSETETQKQDTTAETVGKQNPFEVVQPITEIRRNVLQKSSGSSIGSIIDIEPELSVRSVMLRFLQAKNVESAVRGMLSSSGVVTTDEDTNTLIICDTPERLNVIIAEIREADKDNPKGYYEFERVKQMDKGDTAWLAEAPGKSVKVISALLKHLPSEYDYRILFMRRNMPEILASQRKMLIRRGENADSGKLS